MSKFKLVGNAAQVQGENIFVIPFEIDKLSVKRHGRPYILYQAKGYYLIDLGEQNIYYMSDLAKGKEQRIERVGMYIGDHKKILNNPQNYYAYHMKSVKLWFDMGTYKYFFKPSTPRRKVGSHNRLKDPGKIKSTALMVGNMGIVVSRKMGAKSKVIDEYEIVGEIQMELPTPFRATKALIISLKGITYFFDYMTARTKRHEAQTGVSGAIGINLKPSWDFQDDSFSHMITGPSWGNLKTGNRILEVKK